MPMFQALVRPVIEARFILRVPRGQSRLAASYFTTTVAVIELWMLQK